MRAADVVKAYDIRGLVPEQLDPALAHAFGSAFAQVIVIPEGEGGVAVGWDMRDSSTELAHAFAAGVRDHGVDVALIGLCSTDGLYYASGSRELAGAMVTASHNPAGYNGIKLCRRGARPVGQDSGLAEIRDLAQWIMHRSGVHQLPTPTPGELRQLCLTQEYADYLHSLVDLSEIRPLRVVVDAGNGMAGLTAPVVLGTPGLPVRLDPLYFELDGTFPHHDANPLDPDNLRDLQREVVERGADVGLAFDGDADRVFVVDERGRPAPASAITALIAAREVARAVAAGRLASEIAVVHGPISSRSVVDTITELGARAVCSPVGHSHVKAVMAENEAIFGGEHSAHYYFADFWYADTGMLAALHVLAALGTQEQPLSTLLAKFDRYAASGEINSQVPDPESAAQRVRRWGTEQGAVQDASEGLLLRHEDAGWWVSLRSSNTEPLLRLNVEARTPATMRSVRDVVLGLVRQES